MGSCISKSNDDKSFILLQDRPLASGHLKKLMSGIQKNRVKYFASGVHKEYGYEKITQSSLMDVYDRFPLQSFELLDGGTQVIKVSQPFGLLDGGTQFIKSSSLKSKGRIKCIINNLRCTMTKGTP